MVHSAKPKFSKYFINAFMQCFCSVQYVILLRLAGFQFIIQKYFVEILKQSTQQYLRTSPHADNLCLKDSFVNYIKTQLWMFCKRFSLPNLAQDLVLRNIVSNHRCSFSIEVESKRINNLAPAQMIQHYSKAQSHYSHQF